MVPSAWVSLPALPLTANGKVDRKALALLQPDRPRSTGGVPRTPAEQRIAGIFSELLGAELLGAEPVGLEADFFDLGGHSLLATRLVSRVRAVFGVELPLQAVFETPTVEGLAARIGRSPAPPLDPIVRVVRLPREQPLPLSFAQQRLWFLERIEPGAAYLHLPAALDCAGRLDPAALAGSLGEILRRHEGLRTRFVLSGETSAPDSAPAGGARRGPPRAVHRPERPPRGRAGGRAGPPDRRGGRPPLRSRARPPAARRPAAPRAGEPPAAPDRPSRRRRRLVARPAHPRAGGALRGRRRGPAVAPAGALRAVRRLRRLAARASARRPPGGAAALLARAPDSALLPPWSSPRTARGRRSASPRGARRPVRFDAAAVDAMRRLGGATGATLFMAVLAVFQAVLARHAGQDDVAVGTAVADRPDPALEGVIGLFLNLLVLRGDLSGDPTFRTLLRRGRETALGALAHAELPFEQLVEALQPERDLSRGPLFQVLFTLRSEPLPELALPGLALRPADTFPGAVQFDLSLLLEESRSGGIDGWIEHSSDLFDGTTVERLALHCGHLLASAAADPDRRLSDLPLLSEAERAELLVQWNDTRLEVPGPEACIHELVQAQAERTPDRIAVIAGRRSRADLPRAGGPGVPAGAPSAPPGRAARRPGGHLRRAFRLDVVLHPGGPEGGRRVRAARSRLPAGASGGDAGGLGGRGADRVGPSAGAGASLRHPRTLAPEAAETAVPK